VGQFVTRRLPQIITRDEWERLIAQPSKHAPTGVRNAAVMHAMYDGGLRVSEVCDLAPQDVIRTGSNAHSLRVRRGKGGKDRSNLGLPTGAWACLERWAAIRPSSRYFFSTLAGNRLDERYLRQMVAHYAERAGVHKPTKDGPRPINPHMLRHSYATRLIDRGVPVHVVQRALGHSSLQTTQKYLHVNDAKLAEQLREALDTDTGEDATLRRIVREELQAMAHV
jgi:integrase/recombinase XerD